MSSLDGPDICSVTAPVVCLHIAPLAPLAPLKDRGATFTSTDRPALSITSTNGHKSMKRSQPQPTADTLDP